MIRPAHTARELPSAESVEDRLRRIVAVHFDSKWGTLYWLDRARALRIDPVRDIHTIADLAIFGDMDPGDLCTHPMTDYVPRALLAKPDQLVVGQTGGTTGGGAWTAYREDEFCAAFVTPFAVAAQHVGFPRQERWMYIGPSGPHIIGKVAVHLARCVGSSDPFSVDFDSRWAKKLPDGSFARDRYTQHVLEQAMAIIIGQDIGVLFITPVLLTQLAAQMTGAQRERIRGVHYAGMAVSAQELERFQLELFPNAVHLSGYGNTLFGCCLELSGVAGRPLDYFPHGNRLLLEVVDESGERAADGAVGIVRFTRLDESMLLNRLVERDEACQVPALGPSPRGFRLPGVRNPGPRRTQAPNLSIGLY